MTKVRSNRTFPYRSPTFSLINDRGRTRQRTGAAALRGFRQKYRGAKGEVRCKQKGPPAGVGPFASRSADGKVVRGSPGAYPQIWNRRDVARYRTSCEGRGLHADGRCRPWVLCVPAGGVSHLSPASWHGFLTSPIVRYSAEKRESHWHSSSASGLSPQDGQRHQHRKPKVYIFPDRYAMCAI